MSKKNDSNESISNRIKNKAVLGLDQSYGKTGISIEVSDNSNSKNNSKTIYHDTLDFNYLSKATTRLVFKKQLRKLIDKISVKGYKPYIIVERIRLRSQGFLSLAYIATTGGLLASIFDVAYEYKIPVYSVDTRSWKSKIVGTSKPDPKTGDKKKPTMDYLESLGYTFKSDDEADAICIGKYGFLPSGKQKLKLEFDPFKK